MAQRTKKRNNKKALTNTQRSQRRRFLMARKGITETRIETGFVEKELFKRVYIAAGYNSLSEYLILRTIDHGKELGITCADINAEAGLTPLKNDNMENNNEDSK